MNKIRLFIIASILVAYPTFIFAQDKQADLRLRLTQVNLYLSVEKTGKAFELIDDIKKKHPKSPMVLSTEAEAYLKVGNWRKGLTLLDQATDISPDNENIQLRKKSVLKQRSSFVSTSQEVILAGETSQENITTLKGNVRYNRFSNIGITLENNRIWVKSITRSNGAAEKILEYKKRAELFLEHDYLNGDHTKLSLYASEGILGIGGKYTHPDLYGHTEIELYLQKPSWDFVEGIIDGGTKDQLKITRLQRFAPRMRFTASGALNRYGVAKDHNVANSASIQASVGYVLPYYNQWQQYFGNNFSVSLDYILDGEYTLDKDKRLNNDGIEFYPIPLASREVHTLHAYFSKEYSDKIKWDVFAGISADRLGDQGPSLGTVYYYKPTDNIEFELKASRHISTKKSSGSKNELDQIGINFRWYF